MTADVTQLVFESRDEFNRELVAEKVINLLTSKIDISPMVIDGDWGTGKTEFCHKLIKKFQAEHENVRILYVDAFQADHADNPLMTLLAAVLTLLPKGKAKESFLQEAIPVARYALATVGKAAVGHLLKQNNDSPHVFSQKLAAVEHFSNCVKDSPILKQTDLINFRDDVFGFSKLLIEKNNLSLRDVETFSRNLEIYQSLSDGLKKNTSFGYQLLQLFGVFIVCFTPELAESVRRGKTDANQITAPLGDYDWMIDPAEFQRENHADLVAFMLAQDSNINSPKNKLSDELQQSWEETIRGCFSYRGFRGENKFEVINKVIQTLDLGSS